MGVRFQQRSVTDSKARKEDRICTLANRFAIGRPGKIAALPRCSRISWWWISECSADESSRGCVGVVLVSVSASSLLEIPS